MRHIPTQAALGQFANCVLLKLKVVLCRNDTHAVLVINNLQHTTADDLHVNSAAQVVTMCEPLRVDTFFRNHFSKTIEPGNSGAYVLNCHLDPFSTINVNDKLTFVICHPDTNHVLGVSKATLDTVFQQRVRMCAVDCSSAATLIRELCFLADRTRAQRPTVTFRW